MLNQGYVLERGSEGLLEPKEEKGCIKKSLNHCEDSRKCRLFFPTHHLKHIETGNLQNPYSNSEITLY